jgi:soluble lytic murein transglycosylase-like protein
VNRRSYQLLTALLLLAPAGLYAAQAGIPWGYEQVATERGIPADLLYAVALTESGRRDQDGFLKPWPWALNVAGTSRFFATRAEAETALAEALPTGVNVDVGLMQISTRWHGERLGSIQEALAPYRNLRLGAAILLECRRTAGEWTTAVGCYHSRNPERAAAYAARVRSHREGLQ